MSEVKIPQTLLNVIADINVEEINSHIYTNEKLVSWLCSWHEEIKRELYDFANNKAEQIRADAIEECKKAIEKVFLYTDNKGMDRYADYCQVNRNSLMNYLEQLKSQN